MISEFAQILRISQMAPNWNFLLRLFVPWNKFQFQISNTIPEPRSRSAIGKIKMVCRENSQEIYALGILHKELGTQYFAQSQQAEV